jgi:hypothetical protein
MDDLVALLRVLTARERRVLVGFDFPYGYPRGLAAALRLTAGTAPHARAWRGMLDPGACPARRMKARCVWVIDAAA